MHSLVDVVALGSGKLDPLTCPEQLHSGSRDVVNVCAKLEPRMARFV